VRDFIETTRLRTFFSPSTTTIERSPERLGQISSASSAHVHRFWAAVPGSDFIVNFITRSATSLYTGGITCAVMLPPIWALGLAFLFMLIVAATIFRYGICRDGVNGPWKVHRFTPMIKAANCLRRFPTKKKPLGI
jgi:hypothetical protein